MHDDRRQMRSEYHEGLNRDQARAVQISRLISGDIYVCYKFNKITYLLTTA